MPYQPDPPISQVSGAGRLLEPRRLISTAHDGAQTNYLHRPNLRAAENPISGPITTTMMITTRTVFPDTCAETPGGSRATIGHWCRN
jgi:hypothetical protein